MSSLAAVRPVHFRLTSHTGLQVKATLDLFFTNYMEKSPFLKFNWVFKLQTCQWCSRKLKVNGSILCVCLCIKVSWSILGREPQNLQALNKIRTAVNFIHEQECMCTLKMMAWHDRSGNCFHKNNILGGNTYKPYPGQQQKSSNIQLMLAPYSVITS